MSRESLQFNVILMQGRSPCSGSGKRALWGVPSFPLQRLLCCASMGLAGLLEILTHSVSPSPVASTLPGLIQCRFNVAAPAGLWPLSMNKGLFLGQLPFLAAGA